MSNVGWGDIPSGNKTSYVTLQQGDNRMRVLGTPYKVDQHWEETHSGGKVRVVCLGAGCPICKVGKQPQTRYQVNVINRATGKVEVLEGGPQIFRQIKEYAMDEDYGDPTKYDIKIKKEGSGRDTTYTVKASPNKSELTAEEKALLETAPNLAEINAKKTVEEIKALGLVCLGGPVTDEGLDDDFDAPASSSGKSNQPSVSLEDEDWDNL